MADLEADNGTGQFYEARVIRDGGHGCSVLPLLFLVEALFSESNCWDALPQELQAGGVRLLEQLGNPFA